MPGVEVLCINHFATKKSQYNKGTWVSTFQKMKNCQILTVPVIHNGSINNGENIDLELKKGQVKYPAFICGLHVLLELALINARDTFLVGLSGGTGVV